MEFGIKINILQNSPVALTLSEKYAFPPPFTKKTVTKKQHYAALVKPQWSRRQSTEFVQEDGGILQGAEEQQRRLAYCSPTVCFTPTIT